MENSDNSNNQCGRHGDAAGRGVMLCNWLPFRNLPLIFPERAAASFTGQSESSLFTLSVLLVVTENVQSSGKQPEFVWFGTILEVQCGTIGTTETPAI